MTGTGRDAGHGAEPTSGGGVAFNHVGVCVTDLARSRRFYEEALEFRYWWELVVPDEAAGPLMQLDAPVGAQAVYLVKGGFVLELIAYAGAGVHPSPRRVMNDLGFTHLSVAVADMAATLARVRPLGGEILEDTDMGGRAVMIRDPDSQLIELTTFGFQDMRPPWPE